MVSPACRIDEMDFPMEPVSSCSVPIYEGTADTAVDGAVAKEDGECSHVSSMEPEQSVVGIVQAIAGCGEQDADEQADSAVSTGKMDPQSPGWTKSIRRILQCYWRHGNVSHCVAGVLHSPSSKSSPLAELDMPMDFPRNQRAVRQSMRAQTTRPETVMQPICIHGDSVWAYS
ncbi:hypothetical protein ACQ4PT_070374 [Festuca glaucescens]